MAAITNYTTLVTAVIETSEDDSVELAEYIPVAIGLAEERIFREMDFLDLDLEATGSLAEDVNSIPKPSGYEWALSLGIVEDGEYSILQRKTRDFIRDYWPNSTQTGVPKYYTEKDAETLRVAPTADTTYTYILDYQAKPTPLSTNNLTNYYTDNVPDVLFYATMVEIVKFQKAWTQVQIWESTFQIASNSWNLQASKQRRDSGQVPLNPEGGPNTSKHNLNSNS